MLNLYFQRIPYIYRILPFLYRGSTLKQKYNENILFTVYLPHILAFKDLKSLKISKNLEIYKSCRQF